MEKEITNTAATVTPETKPTATQISAEELCGSTNILDTVHLKTW